MSPLKRSNNLAARMGHWSATHKKTAIFGWLAFVACTFMVGNIVGTKQLDPKTSGTGESGHADAVLANHFKQPQGDSVLIQSTAKTVDDPAFRAAIADVTRSCRARAGAEDDLTAHARTRRPDLQGPAQRARRGRAAHDRPEEAKTLDEPVEQALIAANARHPGIAIEEFGVNVDEAVRQGDPARLPEGRRVLDPGDAARARDRVRRAGRRGAAAAARAHRRLRHDRSAGDAQPADAARPGRRRGRAADRPGRRRRLLDVLSQARTGGAGRRPRRARGGRGCRGATSGPIGARLRRDRDGRDGRHAVHRRQDVHGLRPRDDDRRRDRGARIAHRAAGDARRPGDQVERLRCRSCTGSAAPGRRSCVERDPRSRAAPSDRVVVLAGGFLLALATPALHLHIASPGYDTLPAGSVGGADLPQAPEGVPGDAAQRRSWSRPTTRTSPTGRHRR